MNLKVLLLFTACFGARVMTAQAGMDQTRFKTHIINQWWSCENQPTNKECDMRLLIIRTEGFEFNCVNWSNGFSGCKCVYELKIAGGFFEITAQKCPDASKYGYLYGYLNETNNLLLLMRKEPMVLNNALLQEKDWLKFEKITR